MDPFIGQIIMFGGDFAPRGWALCDGRLIAISQNQALFSILGTTYGGDGRTTFGLPDLRGRVAIHPGTGPGLGTYNLGQKGGTEKVSLNPSELPAHSHAFQVSAGVGTTHGTSNRFLASSATDNIFADQSDATLNAGAIGNTGNGVGHNNIQPYITVNFIIALQGIFPSRS